MHCLPYNSIGRFSDLFAILINVMYTEVVVTSLQCGRHAPNTNEVLALKSLQSELQSIAVEIVSNPLLCYCWVLVCVWLGWGLVSTGIFAIVSWLVITLCNCSIGLTTYRLWPKVLCLKAPKAELSKVPSDWESCREQHCPKNQWFY